MKNNFEMKQEIRKYKELYKKQEVEIAEQKRCFDNNLLIISKQLLVLQKSLQKKDKTLSKTLSRKDKTILKQEQMIKNLVEKDLEIARENILHDDSDSGVVCSDFSDHRVNRSISGMMDTLDRDMF